MKNKKFLTLNQFNIVGDKIEVDFNIIKKYKNVEEIILKNFDITDEKIDIINSFDKIKKVALINCKMYNVNVSLKVETLELDNCILNKRIFSNNIKYLYIQNCDNIDINDLICLNLKTLLIECTKIYNLIKIEEITSLENLYLNEIELNQDINYTKLINLKKINLDGSKIFDKENYLKQFKNQNIEISFEKENNRID